MSFCCFCLSYKKKGIAIAQILTFINKVPRHMSHIAIDLVRRDQVMCVCVCVDVTQNCLANNSRTVNRISVPKAAFFSPRPKEERFRRLVSTRCVFRSFNMDSSIFSQILNAISLAKTKILVTFRGK